MLTLVVDCCHGDASHGALTTDDVNGQCIGLFIEGA